MGGCRGSVHTGTYGALLHKGTGTGRDYTTKGVDEQVTSKEFYELLEWLKKEGYTLDEVINLIKDIANITDK